MNLLPIGEQMQAAHAPDDNPCMTLKDISDSIIDQRIEYWNGSKKKAALSLGISLKALYNRLDRSDIYKQRRKYA